MRNYPEWVLSYWAAISVGASVVGMNAWRVTDEMAYGLEDSAPKILICDQDRLKTFMPVRDQFPDMKIVGVRLAEPVEGVVDSLPIGVVSNEDPGFSFVSTSSITFILDNNCIYGSNGPGSIRQFI